MTRKKLSGALDVAPAEKKSGAPTGDAAIPLTVTRPELMADGSDREFRRLVHALFGFLGLHQSIRDGHAESIGLRGIDYTVLISIAHLATEGEVNVRMVSEHLTLSGAFITTVTRRLSAQGLIHKRTNPADKRQVSLTISKKGLDLLRRLAPTQRQVNDVEFAGLSHEDLTSLLDLMERLIDNSKRAIALQKYLSSRAGPRPVS